MHFGVNEGLGLGLIIIVLCLKCLRPLVSLRSEPWDYISWGEQGKQQAWEPVGHSTLTDWNKYCGTV